MQGVVGPNVALSKKVETALTVRSMIGSSEERFTL